MEGPTDPGASVTLTDWDPEAEIKIVAAALYTVTERPDAELLAMARAMSPEKRARIMAAFVGDRANRRHRPGRAMERTSYRFDVKCDIGAFRDLQRHRMMTIEWQRYTTRLGYEVPDVVADLGLDDEWIGLMDDAGQLYEDMRDRLGAEVAQYAVPFAYNVRFVMDMNPRQAFHLIELRSGAAGHPSYRSVAHQMHAAISEVAGHRLIADAMAFVDYSEVDLERLEAERRAFTRRSRST